MPRLRLATFNLENLDDGPDVRPPLARRIAALRPLLVRLDADVLCLQEVNAQGDDKHKPRRFTALDSVLAGTRYAAFHRVWSETSSRGPADIHNLVTLSRWPIAERRQIFHDLIPPPRYRMVTAMPKPKTESPVHWDRPFLYARIILPGGRSLHVLNLHLRAPLAALVPGQKSAPLVWKSVAGWAEGFYLAAMKRTGQALEARLFVDTLFDREPDAMIAVAGDLNAESRETPVRAVYGDPEDTGNEALSGRALALVENEIPRDKRFTVLHHGKRVMLDHVLVSRSLRAMQRRAEIVNEGLMDEYFAFVQGVQPAGSFHAPVIAEFDLADS